MHRSLETAAIVRPAQLPTRTDPGASVAELLTHFSNAMHCFFRMNARKPGLLKIVSDRSAFPPKTQFGTKTITSLEILYIVETSALPGSMLSERPADRPAEK